MNQQQLAELLDVSVDTLKMWRSTRAKGTPLHLEPDGKDGKQSTYSQDVLIEWLLRPANADYRNRILVSLIERQPVHAGLGLLGGVAA